MNTRFARWGIPLSILLSACHPPAAPSAGAAPRGEVSKERESCASTADCAPPLRCVEAVCRSATTSRLGEYHWMAGELAAAKGDVMRAIGAFTLAATAFEADRVESPPAFLCDHGATLRRNAGDPKAAEQAARLLHRCLLTSAVGSKDHLRALTELAELEAAGLDPALLARDKVADTYLTLPPWKPASIRVEIERTTPPPPPAKGYGAWIEAVVNAEETRRQLGACHEISLVPRDGRVAVVVNAKFKGRYDEDEEMFLMGGTFELEAVGSGQETPATACVKAVLVTRTAEHAEKASGATWAGAITVMLSPEN